MVLKAGALKCARLGLSGGGFKRQPENSKRAHFRGPGASNTTKIPREDTQRERKRERANRGLEMEKKARNFGTPTLRGPTLRGAPP